MPKEYRRGERVAAVVTHGATSGCKPQAQRFAFAVAAGASARMLTGTHSPSMRGRKNVINFVAMLLSTVNVRVYSAKSRIEEFFIVVEVTEFIGVAAASTKLPIEITPANIAANIADFLISNMLTISFTFR